jgi:phosphopantetheine adenylyltransferase
MNKNKKYDVTPDQRVSLLQQMVDDHKKKHDDFKGKIRVVVVDYYIWRYAKEINATIMFRGIRSWERDGKEERSLYLLNTWGPIVCGPFYWPLPTYFLEGDPDYNHISSTFIRDLCKQDNESNRTLLASLVPRIVVPEIFKLYSS